jgi:hypothetical protein
MVSLGLSPPDSSPTQDNGFVQHDFTGGPEQIILNLLPAQ